MTTFPDLSQTTCPPRQRRSGLRASSAPGFLFVLVSGLLGLYACTGDDASSPRELDGAGASDTGVPDTPVVLISIDTLRSDRLPIYGYDAVETPHIDRLRADSILAERAYSHINLTLPSHTSIFTGQQPWNHGVRDNIGYTLDPELHTVAEILGEHGYDTAGFVSSYVLRRETGISQGFATWDDAVPVHSEEQLASLQRDGADTLGVTLPWLDDVGERPFFLFFHIYDPHAPYEPRQPWADRYENAYDAEVAESDDIVGGLLERLRELDLYDRSLIVLLSDHGEGLMDHGEMDHIVYPYREVLQVPLLVKLPDSERGGSTVETPVQTSDVLPTLLDWLHLPWPERLDGRNWLDLDLEPEMADRAIVSESVYPQLHLGWHELGSVIQGPLHLLEGRYRELFDLVADPGETVDLNEERADDAERLSRLLAQVDRTLQEREAVDSSTQEALAALGYVSGAIPSPDARDLPDPRDKTTVLQQLARGFQYSEARRFEEAAKVYENITRSEPNMVLAWQQLGRSRNLAGDHQGSLEAFLQGFEVADGAPHLALSVAEMAFKVGDLDMARQYAEVALRSYERTHHLLAQIALREQNFDEAARQLELARPSRGQRIGPLITEAALYNKLDQPQRALEALDTALRDFGDRQDLDALSGLYFQRGTALGRLGRFEEATEAYRREIEVSPDSLGAYSHLAFVLAVQGDGQAAVGVLRELVEAHPTPAAHIEAARTLVALGDPASGQALLASARQRWPDDPDLRAADLSDADEIRQTLQGPSP